MKALILIMLIEYCIASPKTYLAEINASPKNLIQTKDEGRPKKFLETNDSPTYLIQTKDEDNMESANGQDYFYVEENAGGEDYAQSDLPEYGSAGGEDYADQIELPEDYIVADTPDAKVERFIELFGYLEFNDDDKEVLYDIVNSKGLNVDKLKSFKDKLLSESPKGLKDVQPYMDVMLDFIDKVLFATKP